MGTHIIWRNPSPPLKRSVQVSRVTRNQTAAVYQAVTSGGFKCLFQLFRSHATGATAAAVRETAVAAASPRASLVAARW